MITFLTVFFSIYKACKRATLQYSFISLSYVVIMKTKENNENDTLRTKLVNSEPTVESSIYEVRFPIAETYTNQFSNKLFSF